MHMTALVCIACVVTLKWPATTLMLGHKSHGFLLVAGVGQLLLKRVNVAEGLHGNVFKFVDGHHFIAYEHVKGNVRDLSHISIDFFQRLAE